MAWNTWGNAAANYAAQQQAMGFPNAQTPDLSAFGGQGGTNPLHQQMGGMQPQQWNMLTPQQQWHHQQQWQQWQQQYQQWQVQYGDKYQEAMKASGIQMMPGMDTGQPPPPPPDDKPAPPPPPDDKDRPPPPPSEWPQDSQFQQNNTPRGGIGNTRGGRGGGRGGNQNFGGPNQSVGGGNLNFGRGSQNFGGSNQNFGGSNQNFGGSNQNVGRGNQNFGGSNQNFGGANQNVGRGNQNFGGGNQSIGGGNQNVGVGNAQQHNMNYQPQDMNFQNQNSSFQKGKRSQDRDSFSGADKRPRGQDNFGFGHQENQSERGRGQGGRGTRGNRGGRGRDGNNMQEQQDFGRDQSHFGGSNTNQYNSPQDSYGQPQQGKTGFGSDPYPKDNNFRDQSFQQGPPDRGNFQSTTGSDNFRNQGNQGFQQQNRGGGRGRGDRKDQNFQQRGDIREPLIKDNPPFQKMIESKEPFKGTFPHAKEQSEVNPQDDKVNKDEPSEAEKAFDEQFKLWEKQFTTWKEQNIDHPDKNQYREYEAKWEGWREQLLTRREVMRKKREGGGPQSSDRFESPSNKFSGSPIGLLPLDNQPSKFGAPEQQNKRPSRWHQKDPAAQIDNAGPSKIEPLRKTEEPDIKTVVQPAESSGPKLSIRSFGAENKWEKPEAPKIKSIEETLKSLFPLKSADARKPNDPMLITLGGEEEFSSFLPKSTGGIPGLDLVSEGSENKLPENAAPTKRDFPKTIVTPETDKPFSDPKLAPIPGLKPTEHKAPINHAKVLDQQQQQNASWQSDNFFEDTPPPGIKPPDFKNPFTGDEDFRAFEWPQQEKEFAGGQDQDERNFPGPVDDYQDPYEQDYAGGMEEHFPHDQHQFGERDTFETQRQGMGSQSANNFRPQRPDNQQGEFSAGFEMENYDDPYGQESSNYDAQYSNERDFGQFRGRQGSETGRGRKGGPSTRAGDFGNQRGGISNKFRGQSGMDSTEGRNFPPSRDNDNSFPREADMGYMQEGDDYQQNYSDNYMYEEYPYEDQYYQEQEAEFPDHSQGNASKRGNRNRGGQGKTERGRGQVRGRGRGGRGAGREEYSSDSGRGPYSGDREMSYGERDFPPETGDMGYGARDFQSRDFPAGRNVSANTREFPPGVDESDYPLEEGADFQGPARGRGAQRNTKSSMLPAKRNAPGKFNDWEQGRMEQGPTRDAEQWLPGDPVKSKRFGNEGASARDRFTDAELDCYPSAAPARDPYMAAHPTSRAAVWDYEDNERRFAPPVKQPPQETWEDFKPATVIDYDHEPVNLPDITTPLPVLPAPVAIPAVVVPSSRGSFQEPLQTFDYGHGKATSTTRNSEPGPWSRGLEYDRWPDEREERRNAWERDRYRDSWYEDRNERAERGRARPRDEEERHWRDRPDRDRTEGRDKKDSKEKEKDDKDSKDSKSKEKDDESSKTKEPPHNKDKGQLRDPPGSKAPPFRTARREPPPRRKLTPPPDAPPPPSMEPPPECVQVEDLLCLPGRVARPPKIAIFMRGPAGSGKSFVAKLIKDKELENGGHAPRILCLDDYFMTETEQQCTDAETGRSFIKKVMAYEYEPEMESHYRTSLSRGFKKTVDDGYFPFIILDCVNEKLSHFEDLWNYSKQKGFQNYVAEMEVDTAVCAKRNEHNRTLQEIEEVVKIWEPTPNAYPRVDLRSMLQSASITEVEMEDLSDDDFEPIEESGAEPVGAEDESGEGVFNLPTSKWEKMENSGEKLDRLDGLVKRRTTDANTMEDWLQLPDDYYVKPAEPGKKRVRWADLEERKQQERMRAIGFVVGQTDWSRMTDPTFGGGALTKTKYI